jgi:tRNA (guanine9-N1)-methyltransferase
MEKKDENFLKIENHSILPISKNQLKRLKKKEEWEKKKKEIRKFHKEKQKEKKRLKKEKFEEELKNNPKLLEEYNKQQQIPHKTKKERNEEFLAKINNDGIKIVIDCDFENLMNEKSNISMIRQISEIYHINKHTEKPFNLMLFNVGPILLNLLKKNNYENWLGVKIFLKEQFETFDDFILKELYKNQNTEKLNDLKQKIFYLSADSENEINDLNKDFTYIIGGIVDRNKYKFLSYNKAKKLGINHGKFPIGEYLNLNSSKVLTTNHTFAILNEFNLKNDWKEAFLSVIPKRKFE